MACSLEINNCREFYPGEVIEGNLICSFDSVENIVGITCKITGIENTHFILDDQKYEGRYEFYTDECRISEACVAPIGARKYPFSFRLPNSGIPSSFTHDKGRVFYEIVGVISRKNGGPYISWQQIKVVVDVVVANFNDISDDMTMTPIFMALEKDAFLIGEKIKVILDFRNAEEWDMEEITITLQSILEFTSNNPQSKTSTITKDIVKDEYNGPPKSSKELYTVDIQIPQNLKLAYLNCCNLIKGWFEIKAEVCFNEGYSKIDFSKPVQIGHIDEQAQAPILEPKQAPRAEEETPMLLNEGDSPPSSLPTYSDGIKLNRALGNIVIPGLFFSNVIYFAVVVGLVVGLVVGGSLILKHLCM